MEREREREKERERGRLRERKKEQEIDRGKVRKRYIDGKRGLEMDVILYIYKERGRVKEG